jgi:hypothetical protein
MGRDVRLDVDQLAALLTIVDVFGPDQVRILGVVVRGSGGLPPADQPTLFPTIEAQVARVDPPVRPGNRPARRATTWPG